MLNLQPVIISGREVLPIVEGGKGVSVSNGLTSGAFAAADTVGTFSGVNADSLDQFGRVVPQVYRGRTRRERYEELIAYAIRGGITQARTAYERASGRGRLHMNVLWEAAATPRILNGILEGARGLVHGVTCGAGMPYRLAEIASRFGVSYYPIVSSARAFRALWKRAYHRSADLLGGVVYEDPWRAGGHNGLSNSENPRVPEDPMPRVIELRRQMRECGLNGTPIFMAGGVWYLREWRDWINNPDLGPIAFQFGTRPVVTKESPVSEEWKRKLLTLEPNDITLHRFSPTGFYSSSVRNTFLETLIARSERQIAFTREPMGEHTEDLAIGVRGRLVYVTGPDKIRAETWMGAGFREALRTPDSTLVFVTPEEAKQIHQDQQACMGCLSQCLFSGWSEKEEPTASRPDPRSFCIQKTLQSIAHDGDVDNNLLFAGHNAYRFASDPFYSNGFIPSVGQLVDRICTGD